MVRILHIGTKYTSNIKTIKVVYRINRLRENKKVLVKVVKRINQIFLAETNYMNFIKI